MRPIDADALPIRKAYIVDEAGFGATFYVVDVENIDCAPTIDAVPVVRCKECKHWMPSNVIRGDSLDDMQLSGVCPLMRFTRMENDFCCEGEREKL